MIILWFLAMENFINKMKARNSFDEFVDAIDSESDEIQKTLSLIDDVVANNESTGFKKCLESGTEYYRARIIDPADDGN